MYAATTKDEGNAADGRFSTACEDFTPDSAGMTRKMGGDPDFEGQDYSGN